MYGSYSRGFKSGKFDLEFLHTDDTPFPQRPLDPEILDVFELGVKSTLRERSLLLNGAVFYNIWKDQQVFNVGVNGPEFFNLPRVPIEGAELETNWVPAQRLAASPRASACSTHEITDVDRHRLRPAPGRFPEGPRVAAVHRRSPPMPAWVATSISARALLGAACRRALPEHIQGEVQPPGAHRSSTTRASRLTRVRRTHSGRDDSMSWHSSATTSRARSTAWRSRICAAFRGRSTAYRTTVSCGTGLQARMNF